MSGTCLRGQQMLSNHVNLVQVLPLLRETKYHWVIYLVPPQVMPSHEQKSNRGQQRHSTPEGKGCCETCINRCSHFFYSLNVEARSKSTYIYSLDRRNFFWRLVNGWKTNFSAIILNLGGPRDQCFAPSPSFLFPYYHHAGGDLISFFPFALYESRVTSPSIACSPP